MHEYHGGSTSNIGIGEMFFNIGMILGSVLQDVNMFKVLHVMFASVCSGKHSFWTMIVISITSI